MIKIVTIALLSAILITYLKSINSEYSLLATIGASIIITFCALDYISNSFTLINQLIELSGVDKDLYKIIFKITAIAYLVEFGAGTIEDFGLKSIADKLVFTGKIMIFIISMPIIYAVFNLFTTLIK